MEQSKTAEKSPSRLGRGLSALIPPAAKPAAGNMDPLDASADPGQSAVEGAVNLSLAQIVPNALQPRADFDQAALSDLAESIKSHGVLQPVMVRPRGGGRFELVAGERRFRAAQAAGLTEIPAVVRSLTDEESLTVALIENVQREDLNPIEAAHGYKQLMDDFGMTQAELGAQIGKKQSTLSNIMGLLRLQQEIQDSIADGRLSVEHGKILLSIDSDAERLIVWRDFLALKMSRKDAREHAKIARIVSNRPRVSALDIYWQELEDRLRRAIGSKITLKPSSSGGGTVTIHCGSADELEGILERLHA